MVPTLIFITTFSATEICRHTGSPDDQLPLHNGKELTQNNSFAQCLLCPDTVGAKPRPDTVYYVNGRCSWTTVSDDEVDVGDYALARGQHLMSLSSVRQQTTRQVLRGAVSTASSGCGLHHLTLTSTFVAKGRSVAGLVINTVHVADASPTVLILNDGTTDTIDATDAQIINPTSDEPFGFVVGMVHATGKGIAVECSTTTNKVALQTFVATEAVSIQNCAILNLTALFDVMGSAVTNAMYDVPPPQWLLTIQEFNVKATGWLILLTALYFVAKPPPQPKEKEE